MCFWWNCHGDDIMSSKTVTVLFVWTALRFMCEWLVWGFISFDHWLIGCRSGIPAQSFGVSVGPNHLFSQGCWLGALWEGDYCWHRPSYLAIVFDQLGPTADKDLLSRWNFSSLTHLSGYAVEKWVNIGRGYSIEKLTLTKLGTPTDPNPIAKTNPNLTLPTTKSTIISILVSP